jgi:hypothetical protein
MVEKEELILVRPVLLSCFNSILDMQGIIGTGTGTIDIREQKFTESNEPSFETAVLHPLTKKFLEDGPLNPYFHTRWNPKTGRVEPLTSQKPKKIKKKTKKKVIIDLVDDESSSLEIKEPTIDPLAFLNRKKKLGGVVDLALKKRDSLVPTVLTSLPSFHTISNGNDVGSGDGSPISLPQISKQRSDRGDMSPLSTQRSITQVISSTDQQQQRALFNQIYSMVTEIDDLTHPKPLMTTREEKNAWTRQTEERKVDLVKQCEEIA